MEHIIEARNVVKVYKSEAEDVIAIDHIDFTIEAGEFAVINGPSGSGKSTLLHLLAMIDTPSSGSVFFENRDVSRLTDAQRTENRRDKVGLVFQNFELVPVLTVWENVEYPLLLQRLPSEERKKRVTEILTKTGILQLANRIPSKLSGGQKQRVAISRALVTAPRVILADEPTGNLDSKTARSIMELFLELNSLFNVAIVIVTHDTNINSMARKLYHIIDGKIEMVRG